MVAPIRQTFESKPPTLEMTQPSVEGWKRAVEAVRASHPRLGTSLAFGRLVELGAAEVAIAFPKEAAFHRGSVGGAGKLAIETVLSRHFGRETHLRVDESPERAAAAPPSPAEREALERAAQTQQIEEMVRNHPAVRASIQILGGNIEHIEVLEPAPPISEDAG